VANFTAGTSFTDGVTNDVTAAKLNALVADAVPTSSLALASTTGTISNFTASTANITLGTISTLTAGTTTGTAGIFTSGTVATLNSTTGTIGNLSTTLAGDLTISQGTSTLGTSGVTASSYGTTSDIPRITVDAKGRITAASTVTNPVGFRNRIINGDMRIDQRNAGASQTFTAAAALAYSVDRFYGYCTGANVTGARVAGTAPNEFVYRYTGAASVTAIGFGTRLEATNTTDLAGSTATLSVQLANSLLTSVTWTAFYATTADAFGTLASPTRTQIATGTFTVTSTLTTYSAQISVPSAATTGIEIVFTVGAQTSGTWTIDNVQLEAGSTATDFERRPYGTELALCQRYYEKSYNIDVVPATSTALGVLSLSQFTNELVGFKFVTTKRNQPTVTLYSTSGNINQLDGNTNTATAQYIGTSAVGYISRTAASGSYYFGHFTASSEL
jgi:hypothetical protein